MKYSTEECLGGDGEDDLKKGLENPLALKSVFCSRVEDGDLLARIAECKNLESLGLSLCEGNKLAGRLDQLPSLKSVNFQACRLIDFPQSVLEVSQLESLSLGNNVIETIPLEVSKLNALVVLNLQQNHLQELPDSLFDLPVKKLNLSYNRIENLNSCVGNLKQIELLSLACNAIASIPDSIGNLRTLKSLALGFNRLTTIPKTIERLGHLEFLSLQNNPFEELPKELKPVSVSVKNFSIDGKHRPLFMDWDYQPSDLIPKIELDAMELLIAENDPLYRDTMETLKQFESEKEIAKVRRAIKIQSTEPDDYSILGNSRLGGFPDLENESDFPMTDGKRWAFLAQLNLAELAGTNNFLPRMGLLSFFIPSTEEMIARVVFSQCPSDELKTVRFSPEEMLDDQDDYSENPHRVSFELATDYPYDFPDNDDKVSQFESVFEALHCKSDHVINGFTFTQHESPQQQAANQHRGKPDEWVCLLKLGYDQKVGFCFWDAGTVTFTIHVEDLRRHDFSRVHVSLESS
jgi:uncharacterized protein YwqG